MSRWQAEKSRKELLQECMNRAVEQNEIAGCILSIVEDGKETVYLESGYADKESNSTIARTDIFRMYSMSKPVTAAAFMKLVEDGYVDLCDPVYRFLPSFRHQNYLAKLEGCRTEEGGMEPRILSLGDEHAMTIGHLLNMTSGLVYPDETIPGKETDYIVQDAVNRLGTEHAMTTQEFADRIGSCTLLFKPGTSWHYGVSADILGAIIEVITGMSFADFVKESILDPCGMTDTAFYVPSEKRSRLVTAYENLEGKEGVELVPYTGCHLAIRNQGEPNSFESGGAGLFSTLDDYAQFTQMLMNQGMAGNGKRVLRRGTVRYMTTGCLSHGQQLAFDEWHGLEGYSYGRLNRVLWEPGEAMTIGHKGEYGWDGWLGTYFNNDPQMHRTILLFLNQKDYGTGRMTRQIRNIIHSWDDGNMR